jgi:hypothetical protein
MKKGGFMRKTGRFVLSGMLFFAAGCSQQGPVSNAATGYTKSLQQDVKKAEDAAEKAREAIAKESEAAAQAAAQQ